MFLHYRIYDCNLPKASPAPSRRLSFRSDFRLLLSLPLQLSLLLFSHYCVSLSHHFFPWPSTFFHIMHINISKHLPNHYFVTLLELLSSDFESHKRVCLWDLIHQGWEHMCFSFSNHRVGKCGYPLISHSVKRKAWACVLNFLRSCLKHVGTWQHMGKPRFSFSSCFWNWGCCLNFS